MSFRVRIDAVAARQIDRFVTYLRDYSEDFAVEQCSIVFFVTISQYRRSCGATSRAREHPIVPICFASDGEHNIGSFTTSMRTLARSTFSYSGTHRGILNRSTFEIS